MNKLDKESRFRGNSDEQANPWYVTSLWGKKSGSTVCQSVNTM